jgi:hypothetical protein
MDVEEITNFTYSRNKLWQKLVTKEAIRKGFERQQDNIIEVRENGELVGVGFYLEFKDELHFVSATIKEGINGVVIMLRALKDEARKKRVSYVSWYTPKYRFKKFKVNGRVNQCHKL